MPAHRRDRASGRSSPRPPTRERVWRIESAGGVTTCWPGSSSRPLNRSWPSPRRWRRGCGCWGRDARRITTRTMLARSPSPRCERRSWCRCESKTMPRCYVSRRAGTPSWGGLQQDGLPATRPGGGAGAGRDRQELVSPRPDRCSATPTPSARSPSNGTRWTSVARRPGDRLLVARQSSRWSFPRSRLGSVS